MSMVKVSQLVHPSLGPSQGLLALLEASRPGGDTSDYSESRAFGALGWGLCAWGWGEVYEKVVFGSWFHFAF